VETARENLALSLREMDEGSFVIFELPGFATTAGGTEVESLAALHGAGGTAFFRDGDTLWVKLVVEDAAADGPVVEQVGNITAQASIEVGRAALPETALLTVPPAGRE
jgi:cell migration-inducing and hyaluronan-binding protein